MGMEHNVVIAGGGGIMGINGSGKNTMKNKLLKKEFIIPWHWYHNSDTSYTAHSVSPAVGKQIFDFICWFVSRLNSASEHSR